MLQRSVAIQAGHKEPHRVLLGRDVLKYAAHLFEDVQHTAALAEACCLADQQAIAGQYMQQLPILVILVLKEFGKNLERIAIVPASRD